MPSLNCWFDWNCLVALVWPRAAQSPPTPLFWATQNFYVDNNEMSTDEFSPDFENGKRHFAMNAKFCARMRAAIAQGLERTPIGVVTTPGTKHPKCATNQITSYDLSRDGR
jgi:hypothetical protein